ncbi:hypothetical protein FPV67DRAFT_585531 [Lyophyllum atratum]|nr:hypothetical protein FPV67DRAFT_585531 [Lyophyllum atratum]
MLHATTEDLNREFDLLLQYNPPIRVLDTKRTRGCPPLTPPLTFYDKHLDVRLMLKRVILIPLETYVSEAVDHTAQSLRDRKISPPASGPKGFFPSKAYRAYRQPRIELMDTISLARLYQGTTGSYSSVVASTLLFHPRAPGWYSALLWNAFYPIGMEEYYPFTGNYALQVSALDRLSPEVQQSMDEESLTILQRLHRRYDSDSLAFWEIFSISPEAEGVLREMDAVSSLDSFSCEACQTKGYSNPPVMALATPDASVTAWGVPVSTISGLSDSIDASGIPPELHAGGGDPLPKKPEPPRRSSRSHKPEVLPEQRNTKGLSRSKKSAMTLANDTSPSWPTIDVTACLPKAEAPSMTNLFLQRAWARSVEHDTTYIVFHCGNFERIGFRHRSSQTLFLSNLIDISHCKNPGYGKIHIGLFLSVVQDAIDRMEKQPQEEETRQSGNRKRPQDTASLPSRKRYKTRMAVLQDRLEAEERHLNQEIVKQEVRRRSLALLELRYGIYNSPAPASFLRFRCVSKDIYTPDEYFTVVLTSRIEAGATGVAHGARLKCVDSDGQTRHLDVVVKLSFGLEETKRLRHEFSIYQHLAILGIVEGIPFIYGLFEDMESNTVALVMSHVGTALITLMPDIRRYDVTISESMRAAFLRVLGKIHEAGVRHRDIRPENLMLSDDGHVAFIDFDMAELRPTEGAMRREMRHITDMLDGSYLPPGGIPSEATTPDGATSNYF